MSTDAPTQRFASIGDVTVCYQTFGDPTSPTMVLIMGLGFQLVHWPDQFCRTLAGSGFHVVRCDNRDSGRSTHLPGATYTLEDMADDTVGLLDHARVGVVQDALIYVLRETGLGLMPLGAANEYLGVR